MNKIILAVLALFFGGAAAAQNGMDVKNIRMVRGADELTLSFELSAGGVDKRAMLTVIPVIAGGGEKAFFPAIAVQGRGAARTCVERPAEYVIASGSSVDYTASIPYGDWMEGAHLSLEAVSDECGFSYAATPAALAENVLRHEERYEIEIVETEIVTVPTTAEKLSRQFRFLQPSGESLAAFEEFDRSVRGMTTVSGRPITPAQRNQLESLIADNRDGSVKIHFRVNNRQVEYDYINNHRSLVELISVLRAVEESETEKVARVVIAGFASPEGDAASNDRLAWERALALNDFLIENSRIDADRISLYNCSVDWDGLRELVAASDMPGREGVLNIIDNVPEWDAQAGRGRRGELMRLDRGEPYRYISREFFPLMRQASFIRVYYEKR